MNQQRDIYLFIGPPGAGKGSLSSLCVRHFGWQQCSTGNLCRQHIASETLLGKQIAFYLKSGKLISDSLIIDMVDEWLTEQQKNYCSVILDGFPRTIQQAQAFDGLLNKPSLALSRLIVVQIHLHDDIIVQRLTNRVVCENKQCQAVYAQDNGVLAPKKHGACDACSGVLVRRPDDEMSAVKERLTIYHSHAQQLLDYYHQREAHMVNLKADGPLEQVFDEFKKIIGLKSA